MKRFLRKELAFLLACCLVFSYSTAASAVDETPFVPFGDEKVVFACESEVTETKRGSEVTVRVVVQKNCGFRYLAITPRLSTGLSLSGLPEAGDVASPGTDGFSFYQSAGNTEKTGTLVTFSVLVGKNVLGGTETVSLSVDSITNAAGMSVQYEVVPLSFEVKLSLSDIALDPTEGCVYTAAGENTVSLTAILTPETAGSADLSFTSDNETVATVEKDASNALSALVTGHMPGTAHITALLDGLSATFTLTVLCSHLHTHRKDAVLQECEKSGFTGDLICDDCGETLEAGTTIAAPGHDWQEATYDWSNDFAAVTATRTCARDKNHVQTETAEVTSLVTRQASCEEKEEVTYTASFHNPAFTTQIKKVEVGEVLGHDWGEVQYAWSAGWGSCTATRTCARDASHILQDTVETVREMTKPASGEEPAEYTYTATFKTEGLGSAQQVKAVVWGDANGDKSVDTADIIRLKNYLAGCDWIVDPGADVNGDGKITVADVIRLKNYLANYDFETGEGAVRLGPA